MTLKLDDLQPQEVSFSISGMPGKSYTLKRFTLAARIWVTNRFGDKVKGIFEDQNLPGISEIAYYLLKDKTDFPTLESFQEAFATRQDFVTLLQSLLTTIGISEPLIKQLSEQEAQAEKNRQSPDPK